MNHIVVIHCCMVLLRICWSQLACIGDRFTDSNVYRRYSCVALLSLVCDQYLGTTESIIKKPDSQGKAWPHRLRSGPGQPRSGRVGLGRPPLRPRWPSQSWRWGRRRDPAANRRWNFYWGGALCSLYVFTIFYFWKSIWIDFYPLKKSGGN